MLSALLLTLSLSASADDVGLKVDSNGSQDTTISIRRGSAPSDSPKNEGPKWEIAESNDEISGDPAPLQKEARKNWKKACDDWRKELKDLNKENKILTISCGSVDCTTSAMETVCKSTSKAKIKTRID